MTIAKMMVKVMTLVVAFTIIQWQWHVRALSFRTLGKIFDFTLEILLLNELPKNIVKGISKEKLRCFYSILNCYKTTVYSTYYIRSSFNTGQSLLYRFNLNLQTSLKICRDRNSKSLDFIHLPKFSFYNFQSFAEIKKSVMTETRSDRREDQIFRRRYNLPKNRSDQHNIPKRKKNTRKNNNVRKVSKQKANLMMINSLKTVPKCHFTRSGELNISKLNRWFWSWCWCCSVCLTCIYIMRRRDHQLSPNKTDIQQ